MKTLFISLVFFFFLIGFTTSQNNKATPIEKDKKPSEDSILKDYAEVIELDSISSLMAEKNHYKERKLENDIKELRKYQKEISKENEILKKKSKKLVIEKSALSDSIDRLNIRLSITKEVDSICYKWRFFASKNDENCKEWKIIIK